MFGEEHMKKFSLTLNEASQLAHVGWGAAIVLASALVHHLRFGTIAMMVLAAVKEITDPYTETPETAGSGLQDFGFWCVGIFGAVLFVKLVG
jgi:hypothetical protein